MSQNETPELIKTKPPKQVPQRESHARVSFLYQAATVSAVSGPEILSRMYNRQMKKIQKKTVLKLSPHLKRTVCKKCDRVMLNGVGKAQVRTKGDGHQEILEVKCSCGEIRRFPVGKDADYQLFVDKSSISLA